MFKNKKIFILGMARSGVAAAKVLANRNNEIFINDKKSEDNLDKNDISLLKEMGCKVILGNHPDDLLDDSFDYVIKNPGIKDDNKLILKARELNIPVINEAEVAYHLLPNNITLIGITGTNGKTTTTTLTYEILKRFFSNRVHLAGNIGYPLCGILEKLKENDIIVMEVSVQQSVNFNKFRPHIALMTNLSPAHIDFVGSFENYKNIKSKMFYNQESNDIAILNLNDKDVLNEMKTILSTKKYFSSTNETDCYLKDNWIYYNNEKVINTNIIKIPGLHNIENILGAIMIAKELKVSNEVIYDVISNFKGVEHRLEFVKEINGVKFYNDTEATNIKSTQIALSSFSNPTIIILGGLERGQDFNELKSFSKNIKAIIGIGECRNKVLEFGKSINVPTYIHEYLKDSFSDIKSIMESGDIVLLSPASASWDQYKECEIRGEEFKELVYGIDKE